MNYTKIFIYNLEYLKMKLTNPLLHCFHHMWEKENEIKLHYVQNSVIIYDDRLIYNKRTVLCNGDIYGYDICYKVNAIEEIARMPLNLLVALQKNGMAALLIQALHS